MQPLAAAALFYSSGAVLTRTQAQAGAAKKPNGVHAGSQTSGLCWQRPREAEFVTIWIGQVEVALAPFGIAGRRRGREPCCMRALIEAIHVGHIEDDASPPGPLPLCRLGDQVQIARSSAKAGERGCFAAEQDLKPERLIEVDSPAHVVGGECDRAQSLNHRALSLLSKGSARRWEPGSKPGREVT